ncbi:hypothetical protein ACEWY4_001684 [Coilia grayii]|uniref:CTNNB1 binding N-teminal domain-containing protein n=1 Tax=Coilia grayii TaxID=363190 RepID=A0ABD1KU36_9TELE
MPRRVEGFFWGLVTGVRCTPCCFRTPRHPSLRAPHPSSSSASLSFFQLIKVREARRKGLLKRHGDEQETERGRDGEEERRGRAGGRRSVASPQLQHACCYHGSGSIRSAEPLHATHRELKCATAGTARHGTAREPVSQSGRRRAKGMRSSVCSNKVPVVQHPHHVHPLTPLITYSNEHFTPGNPPPHLQTDVDPKTGIPRPPHPPDISPYYPLSPGTVGQIPHPLGCSVFYIRSGFFWGRGVSARLASFLSPALTSKSSLCAKRYSAWLCIIQLRQGQPVYPITTGGFRHPYPAALTVNASMSR